MPHGADEGHCNDNAMMAEARHNQDGHGGEGGDDAHAAVGAGDDDELDGAH